jgi:hypothetical protein
MCLVGGSFCEAAWPKEGSKCGMFCCCALEKNVWLIHGQMVHPGLMKTELQRSSPAPVRFIMVNRFLPRNDKSFHANECCCRVLSLRDQSMEHILSFMRVSPQRCR